MTAIVVDVGPGSYTGLRVGIAAAKALAFATGAACVSVSAFHCMAASATLAPGERIFTVRDARRAQVYGALFSLTGGALVRELPDFVAPPAEAAARVPGGAIVVGDGAAAYPSILGPPRYRLGPPEWGSPRAATLLGLGAAALARGEATPADTLAPNYLLTSEPERRAGKSPPLR
jgi:tRNA threonylcarbamoyladenosine biosynthesis protein TsaB